MSGAPGGPDLWHHGDADLGADVDLDLAVNVRLPRPPAWLRARLHAALDELAAYPRPDAAVAAVAARHGRPPDEVLLVNGAAEAFTLIARAAAGQRAVCVHPSFTAPEAALRDAGREVAQVLLEPPFALDDGLVPVEADLVVVGNPTNPTGRLHPVEVLERLARPGRVLVVDEAFADAVPGEPASLSTRRDLPGVLVVRSLTKAWGLAGLRVGYVLGAPEGLAGLRRAQPPWPVNTLALAALEACSQPEAVAWIEQQASVMAGWRAALADALGAVPGVTVVPGGQAPFLLLRVGGAMTVRDRLRAMGIAARRGDTFPGLGEDWLRIAVVAPEHHERIATAFTRALEAGGSGRVSRADEIADADPVSRAGQAAGTAHAHEADHAGEAGVIGGAGQAGGAGRAAGTGAEPDSGDPLAGAGSVALIGAGPGGADLITVRGWRALHEADVVVADRLADPALTGELRPGVLLIPAGKAPGWQQLTQDEINDALIKHAAAGRRVARLKGGDPFVFGRGGEEAAACAAAGVPCTVIPGLSSVTAGPALGGIPLIYREVGQSFAVVTGHLPPGHPADRVNWAGLATGTDTLVLLMAVRNLAAIAGRLVALGRPAGTLVACVESAGDPGQRVRRTTLGDLAAGPLSPPLRNPAVIVIGPTAGDLGIPGTAPSR